MAISGTILFSWTVLHMVGNLFVFAGPETMNRYGATLQGSVLIWLMRVGLVVLVVWHMRLAWSTWRTSSRARATTTRRRPAYRKTTLSARAIRAGGVSIAAFVIYHLLHIYGVSHPNYVSGDVHHNVVNGFRSPLIVAVYLAATLAYCSHIRHGLASALRSIGLGVRFGRLANRAALYVATLVGVGFAAPCVAVVLGYFG